MWVKETTEVFDDPIHFNHQGSTALSSIALDLLHFKQKIPEYIIVNFPQSTLMPTLQQQYDAFNYKSKTIQNPQQYWLKIMT